MAASALWLSSTACTISKVDHGPSISMEVMPDAHSPAKRATKLARANRARAR